MTDSWISVSPHPHPTDISSRQWFCSCPCIHPQPASTPYRNPISMTMTETSVQPPPNLNPKSSLHNPLPCIPLSSKNPSTATSTATATTTIISTTINMTSTTTTTTKPSPSPSDLLSVPSSQSYPSVPSSQSCLRVHSCPPAIDVSGESSRDPEYPLVCLNRILHHSRLFQIEKPNPLSPTDVQILVHALLLSLEHVSFVSKSLDIHPTHLSSDISSILYTCLSHEESVSSMFSFLPFLDPILSYLCTSLSLSSEQMMLCYHHPIEIRTFLTRSPLLIHTKEETDPCLQHEGLDPFCCCEYPCVPIELYFDRIVEYAKLSPECIYIALIYLMRFRWISGRRIHLLNVHRLFLTCCLLASKYHDDHYCNNKTMARIGGITVFDLNTMELEMSKDLSFQLYVSRSEYLVFRLSLCMGIAW